MKNLIRITAMLLSLIMVFSSVPLWGSEVNAGEASLSVAAAGANQKRTAMTALQAADFNGGNIYLGQYDTDKDSTPEVIKWRVLDTSDDLLLLADKSLTTGAFDDDIESESGEILSKYSNLWTGSVAEAWCEGFAAESLSKKEQTLLIETLLDMSPYTTRDIYMQQAPITSPRLEADVSAKVFFLSAKEVEQYLPAPADRSGYYWWLRSPYMYYSEFSEAYVPHNLVVYNNGTIDSSVSSYGGNEYRPAMKIDTSSVIMFNAASDNASSDFQATSPYSGNDWFLTIGDSKTFKATGYTGATTLAEGYAESDITVNHYALNNALYHATNESIYNQVTATLTDAEGNVLYYGKINSDKTATKSTVTVPEGLSAGSYTLSVRGEAWGDKSNMTRVASGTAYEIPITVEEDDGYTATEPEHALQLGTAALSSYSSEYGYDYITFGKDKLLWRVLDTKTNTGADGLFILSEEVLASNVAFNSAATTVYSGSSGDTWAKEFAATDNFFEAELAALLATAKNDSKSSFTANSASYEIYNESNILSSDKLFMLSYDEAVSADFGLDDSRNRVAQYNGVNTAWWLRSTLKSPISYISLAALVGDNGAVKPANVTASYTNDGTTTEYMGYRPGANLDGEKIVFTLAADGSAERAFGLIPEVSTNRWKLAVSTGVSFQSTLSGDTFTAGETLTVTHSELPAGYEHVTAVLKSAGATAPLYYGKLSPVSETQSTLKIPTNLREGKYQLIIYAEAWNEGSTNYVAGTDNEVNNITVMAHEHTWSERHSVNGTHHWHECTNSDCIIENDSDKDGYGAHVSTGVNMATFITKAVCDVCGEEYGDLKPYLGYTFVDNADGSLTLTGYIGSGTDLNIPGSVLGKPVTAIGEAAFQYNEDITSVTIPGNIKTVGKWAFRFCKNIKTINLSEGLEIIGEGGFERIDMLESVEIPSTVKEIGIWAFADDPKLGSVTMHEGVEIIARYAFHNCDSLLEIDIPKTVRRIDNHVFYNCDSLVNICFNGHEPRLGELALNGLTPVNRGENHLGCGEFSCTHSALPGEEAAHNPVEWRSWGNADSQQNSLPVDSLTDNGIVGYYLVSDIALSAFVEIAEGTELLICLNGYNITGGSEGKIFSVSGNGKLFICDCYKEPGSIGNSFSGSDNCVIDNSGRTYLFGGAVLGSNIGVSNRGEFYMYNGTVTENGCGINNIGVFGMFGGEISGNLNGGENGIVNNGEMSLSGGTVTDNIIYAPGDVNQSGKLEVGDLILLSQYVAGGQSTYNSDYNGDSETDSTDLVALAQAVAAN